VINSHKRKETAKGHPTLKKGEYHMKKIIISILVSLMGIALMAASFIFLYSINSLLYKFVVFFGALCFGGGIANIMVARAERKADPPKDED